MNPAVIVTAAFVAGSFSARQAYAQNVGPGDLTAAFGNGGIAAGPLPPPPPPGDDDFFLTAPADEAAGPVDAERAEGPAGAVPDVILEPPELPPIAKVVAGCGCASKTCNFDPSPEGVRQVSDLMDGGTKKSPAYTNMVWSWGQFLDHDFVASFTDANGGKFDVKLGAGISEEVSRVKTQCAKGRCREPRSVTTPVIDAGPVYSNLKAYTDGTLREPNSCKMRMSAGMLPPVTTFKLEAETEAGTVEKHFLLAGDSRVNEHAILTNMHTIWLREHNRLCGEVAASDPDMDGDEAFNLVRGIIEAKMQEITLFEWLPALGISPQEVYHWQPLSPDLAKTSSISTEFFINYRWGHTGVPNTVGGFSIAKIFDGEEFFGIKSADGSEDAAAANQQLEKLLLATSTEAMADLDGQMADSLRNMLFDRRGLDLASFNIFRARDIALPSYPELATCYGLTPNPNVPEDPFVGTMQDVATHPGQAFGPLLRRIMIDQFHRVFFGPQGNWWEFSGRVGNYDSEVIGTKLSDIIAANTGVSPPENVFLVGGAPQPSLVKPSGGGSVAARRGGAGAAAGAAVDDVATAAPADPGFRPGR